MAKAVQKRRKGNKVTIDFTGVKSGGTIPEGRYKAKIIAAEQKEGKESGEPYTELTWEITSDKCNGREVRFDNYSHQPTALWRMKALLEAMGVQVPDGEHEIDWDEMISDETECIIETTHEKRESGTYSRVTGWDVLDSGNTVDDEEEEKPARRAKKKPAAVEEEEEEPPKRVTKKSKDEEEESEEEEEEEEAPASKKVKKGARVKFKDEKNKLRKGKIVSIDGDQAVVEADDGDDSYEMDLEELTIIG